MHTLCNLFVDKATSAYVASYYFAGQWRGIRVYLIRQKERRENVAELNLCRETNGLHIAFCLKNEEQSYRRPPRNGLDSTQNDRQLTE